MGGIVFKMVELNSTENTGVLLHLSFFWFCYFYTFLLHWRCTTPLNSTLTYTKFAQIIYDLNFSDFPDYYMPLEFLDSKRRPKKINFNQFKLSINEADFQHLYNSVKTFAYTLNNDDTRQLLMKCRQFFLRKVNTNFVIDIKESNSGLNFVAVELLIQIKILLVKLYSIFEDFFRSLSINLFEDLSYSKNNIIYKFKTNHRAVYIMCLLFNEDTPDKRFNCYRAGLLYFLFFIGHHFRSMAELQQFKTTNDYLTCNI
jgi:hypothetical protein